MSSLVPAVAGHDEFVERPGSEGRGGGASGVGVDGHDERGGAGRGREDVQVTGVDASVGERGRAVEVVRHGRVPSWFRPRDGKAVGDVDNGVGRAAGPPCSRLLESKSGLLSPQAVLFRYSPPAPRHRAAARSFSPDPVGSTPVVFAMGMGLAQPSLMRPPSDGRRRRPGVSPSSVPSPTRSHAQAERIRRRRQLCQERRPPWLASRFPQSRLGAGPSTRGTCAASGETLRSGPPRGQGLHEPGQSAPCPATGHPLRHRS